MDGISSVTRDRVLLAVEELGYRPSRLAQGMAGSRSFTIGLVIGDITNHTNAEIVRGLQDVADAHSYNVFLRNTDWEPSQELEALRSLVAENVDGIVILGSKLESQVLASLADKNLPIVVVSRHITAPYISSISTDVEKATKTVVDYLFGTGHQVIGLLTREGNLNTIRHVAGYLKAYSTREVPFNKGWIVQAETSLSGGYGSAHKLLSQYNEVTALVAYTDMMAIGALKACSELGKSVPDDIAIFGYGDSKLASFISPTLSTIRYKGYEIGQLAMERLLDMQLYPDATFPPVILDIELVIRESSSR
jgi:DNA-binding LacI/PurR family transcriptional regulator